MTSSAEVWSIPHALERTGDCRRADVSLITLRRDAHRILTRWRRRMTHEIVGADAWEFRPEKARASVSKKSARSFSVGSEPER